MATPTLLTPAQHAYVAAVLQWQRTGSNDDWARTRLPFLLMLAELNLPLLDR